MEQNFESDLVIPDNDREYAMVRLKKHGLLEEGFPMFLLDNFENDEIILKQGELNALNFFNLGCRVYHWD